MKKYLPYLLSLFVAITLSACGGNNEDEDNVKFGSDEGVEYSPSRDENIQRYNLERRKELAGSRTPCDTISLVEHVLNTFPEGTYLMEFDKKLTYNVPKPAVLYYNQAGGNYTFGVIARSRPGERLIESKNIIGYDQSFIDLDSTKLGTAFFYLCLFECTGGGWNTVWETPIPSHGGFNDIIFNTWQHRGINYVKVNFYYGEGIGHINYNYFMLDGLTSEPHLLMTYEGINFKRSLANVNNDKFPDYYEHVYYDLGNRVFSNDSVPFVWIPEDSLYVNTRNKEQTRPY